MSTQSSNCIPRVPRRIRDSLQDVFSLRFATSLLDEVTSLTYIASWFGFSVYLFCFVLGGLLWYKNVNFKPIYLLLLLYYLVPTLFKGLASLHTYP